MSRKRDRAGRSLSDSIRVCGEASKRMPMLESLWSTDIDLTAEEGDSNFVKTLKEAKKLKISSSPTSTEKAITTWSQGKERPSMSKNLSPGNSGGQASGSSVKPSKSISYKRTLSEKEVSACNDGTSTSKPSLPSTSRPNRGPASFFDDTNLGLYGQQMSFSSANRSNTKSNELARTEQPRQCKEDPAYTIPKCTGDESNVRAGVTNHNEKYFQGQDRMRSRISAFCSDTTLQRAPLESSNQNTSRSLHSHLHYKEVLTMAHRNVGPAFLTGRRSRITVQRPFTYQAATLDSVAATAPKLKVNATTSVCAIDVSASKQNLSWCQIGLMVVEHPSMATVDQDGIKLKLTYNGCIALFTIQFGGITECRYQTDMKRVSFRLNAMEVAKIQNYIEKKLHISQTILKCATSYMAETSCHFCFASAHPQMHVFIADLRRCHSGLSAVKVRFQTNEQMDELIRSTQPPLKLQRIPESSPSMTDASDRGPDEVPSACGGCNTNSFYSKPGSNKALQSTFLPDKPSTIPKTSTAKRFNFNCSSSSITPSTSSFPIPSTSSSATSNFTSSTTSNFTSSSTTSIFTSSSTTSIFTTLPSTSTSTCTSSSSPLRRSSRISENNPEMKRPNNLLLKYQPKGCKVGVELMLTDVDTLQPGKFLNDKIMDFYLKYMMFDMLEEELQPKLHIFSSFFYTRLSNASMDDQSQSMLERVHGRVKTWTKHVDLFSKDYIVIPVCDKSHWYVVFVCYPGKFDPRKVTEVKPRGRPKVVKPKLNKRRTLRDKRPKRVYGASRHGPVILSSLKEGDDDHVMEDVDHIMEEDDHVMEEDDQVVEEDKEDRAEAEKERTMADGKCKEALNDLLHVSVYCDDFEDEEMEQCKGEVIVTGETIVELGCVKTASQKQHLPPLLPLSSSSSSSSCTLLSYCPTNKLKQDPGIAMWAGSPTFSTTTTTNGSNQQHHLPYVKAESSGNTTALVSPFSVSSSIPASRSAGVALTGEGGTRSLLRVEENGVMEAEVEEEMVVDGVGLECALATTESECGAGDVKIKVEDNVLDPCLMVLDSLGIRRPATIRKVRNYLTQEWKVKKSNTSGIELKFDHLPLLYPKIPLQHNSSDCGIYVLQYIETLVQFLKQDMSLPRHNEEWGSYSEMREKRTKIAYLIDELERNAG